jgi:sugar lactone lactonase YvrE
MSLYDAILLDWSASKTQDLGSNVTYTLFAKNESDLGANVLSNTTGINELTYTFGGLETGALYNFTIIATCSAKSSIPEDVPAVIIRTAIHPVFDLVAASVSGTFGTIAAEWNPGTNYDMSYEVVLEPTSGPGPTVTVNVDSPQISTYCLDLLPDTLYRVIVTTYIAGQSSEPAIYTYALTNPVIPSPNLTVTDIGITTIGLSWEPATIETETVTYNISATSATGVPQNFVGIPDTEVVCGNLTSGALYNLSLYTVYKGIQSADAIGVDVKTLVGPPTNLEFTPCNATSVEITWDPSPAQIPGQNVVYNLSGNNVIDPLDYFYKTTSNNAGSYLLNGIINPGALYDVYITAEYDMSESVPALIQIFTGTAPPTNLQALATDLTTDSISLTWEASLTIEVTYQVTVDGGTPIDIGDTLYYNATGLDPGSTHTFSVVAVAGTNASDPATATATTYIAPPFSLSNIATAEYALAFGWQSIDSTSYELNLSGGGSNTIATAPETTYEFSGLFSGEGYDASVRSILGDLCSYSVNFENPFYTSVAPITNLSAHPAGGAAGSTSIVLTWSLSPADYDPGKVLYDVFIDNGTTCNGITPPFTVVGLDPATPYAFDVQTRRMNPRRTSTKVMTTASTNAQTYPTMTWDSNSYSFDYAPDAVLYGALLARDTLWVTDISGGDVWSAPYPIGANLAALGVLPVFNEPRGISYNPLAAETPLLVAHTDGVTAVSLDGTTLVPVDGAAGGGWGITTDVNGNTYVSIPATQTIQLIDSLGNVSDYATLPPESNPEGIALADNGSLYVADSSGNSVWEVMPDGTFSVLTSNIQFNNPSAIVYSVDGNLYIADRGNRKIFKVTLAGSVSLFTTLAPGFTPLAMAQDPTTGNLYTTHPNGTVTEIQVTLT